MATKNNDTDLFNLADSAYESGDFKKAFELFSIAAKNGDASAMSRLAMMYYDGEGTAHDFEKSVFWDLQAINSGCLSSMSNLAITYREYGDSSKALEWFTKAYQSGEVDAALDMAKLLMISEKKSGRVLELLNEVANSKEACTSSVEEAQKLLNETNI